mmetsp:Transcript_70239/g.222696  ORF Transcript_70239/g.222696 Transcript_70239/m.222696 type:complete len:445 (+) Transcript_70239:477-1811(+)
MAKGGGKKKAAAPAAPPAPSQAEGKRRKLVGASGFKRENPHSDRFDAIRFHHIEFYCSDATNTFSRFGWGLGMNLVAKTDQSTGNHTYASYAIKSNEVIFAFTSPYGRRCPELVEHSVRPHPGFRQDEAQRFVVEHGLAARAIGILVGDCAAAYKAMTANGMAGVLEPAVFNGAGLEGEQLVAEVALYGDVVLRLVEDRGFKGSFLGGYESVDTPPLSYGLQRMDHVVGNVYDLIRTRDYITKGTGFHEFAEFVASDVGTINSGLNSVVLASNNEMVLLPVNEPTFGTKRRSQIQTYLEQNQGPGLQHIALKTDDIFATLREMRQRTHCGGFDFMPKPNPVYYQRLPGRLGDALTATQYKECEELGILGDKDDQGVLLQIFTKPLGDRPTVFIEIIQRVGCLIKDKSGREHQAAGCGGFGKGNFSELFKSIEDYEKTLDAKAKA